MNRILRPLVFTFIAVLFGATTYAQPGCPDVDAGADANLPCGSTCTNITASFFQAGNTTSYSVGSIPYTPFSYTAGTTVLANQDDIWSCAIALPFTFCFFGQSYNQFIIAANAAVSFTPQTPCIPPLFYPGCTWPIGAAIPSGLPTDMLNTIMAPWHDIDPEVGGDVRYQVIGTAPCRILVVSWNQVPMYSTTCNNLIATSQVAIYETTNVIEIYIANKPSCTTWNSGYSIEGIQNANGTSAYVVPGRNYPNVWAAQNDAWRFTPNGPSIVNFEWLQGGTQISTNPTTQVCPTAPTTYTARATYTPCTGGTPIVVTDNVTVSPGGTLVANIASTQNVTCFGGNNGAATATVSGGVAPVNYGWSTGSGNLSVSGLTAGNYTFTVSDNTGCTVTLPVNITQPTQITFNPATIQNIGCSGGSNGSITANPTGGTPPYTYAWVKQTGGQTYTGQTISNLTADSYAVTVTDGANCTAVASYSVTSVPPLSFTLSTTNVTCNGGTNGTATATVATGTTPYQYNWNGAGYTSNATQTGLAAGTVNVTVSDANCSASASATVTQPTAMQLNAPVIQNISCGSGTGSITASATGGTAPLTYSWAAQTSGLTYTGASIVNLSADTYNLTVTDNIGCSITTSYQVTQTATIQFTQASTPVSCNGGNDGTASITITAGSPPYLYNWNGTGNTSNSSITGLSAGTVNVTITDANCSVAATFNITQPPAMGLTLQNQTDVTCFGGNNGSLSVLANGGSGTYTYTWNNGTLTGSTISSLTAIDYALTVSDGSCSVTAIYTILEPTELVFDPATIQSVGCSGGTTASITANPVGGTPPYTYAWVQQSNSQTYSGQTISNLSGDTYNLTVTDNNTCTAIASYQVTQVTPLTFTQSNTNVSCNGGNNATATIAVSTGTPPYQYNWNGTGNTPNAMLNSLTAGTVSVTITDANCSATATFTITEPPALSISSATTTNVLCAGGNNGSITVSATGGTTTTGYTYTWSNQQTGPTATGLVAGAYTVVVTDDNSCSVSQQYTITAPSTLTINVTATDATCYQAANGSATATAGGGTPPYNFAWSDGQTTESATALVATTYTCTVTDDNGCSISGSALVSEPTDVIINTQTAAVKCVGDKNGTIAVSAAGGNPPYNYSATQDFANFVFATNDTIRDLAPGDYFVIVSDNKGCTKTVQANVPEATPDLLSIATDSTSCYGPDYNDGAAFVTVDPASTANAPYEFSVDGSPKQYSPDFYFLSAGPHILTTTSKHGCVSNWPFIVEEPLPIVAQVTPDSLLLALGSTGQVVVTYQNAGYVTYSWGPSTGLSCIDCPNPYVLVYDKQEYIVTVSTVNGTATCFTTAKLHVDILPHLPVFIPNTFTPNGDGNNDVFQIYGEGIKTIDLKIFNRWGELVYESNNQFNGWDGTYKGQLQLPQVFTYYATVTFLNDKEFEQGGSVTLVR